MVLPAPEPVDFLPTDACVTVDVDAVTVVVVERVSAWRGLAVAAVDEAAVVSAADCSDRSQAATKTTTANALASESFVIDLCRVLPAGQWVCVAIQSPTPREWGWPELDSQMHPPREC